MNNSSPNPTDPRSQPAIPGTLPCPRCGTLARIGDNYCPCCGNRLAAEEQGTLPPICSTSCGEQMEEGRRFGGRDRSTDDS